MVDFRKNMDIYNTNIEYIKNWNYGPQPILDIQRFIKLLIM